MLAGDRIKENRKRLGLSQEKLGEMIGVTKVAVCGYEKGIKQPTVDNLIKMSDILNLSPNELLNRDINAVCENIETYNFKISKKEMKLIKELRQDKEYRNEIYMKLKI